MGGSIGSMVYITSLADEYWLLSNRSMLADCFGATQASSIAVVWVHLASCLAYKETWNTVPLPGCCAAMLHRHNTALQSHTQMCQAVDMHFAFIICRHEPTVQASPGKVC